MKFQETTISLQEVPGEISLIFQISECPHRCSGCHSPELWTGKGVELTSEHLLKEIGRYSGLITCVCFFGGEWEGNYLIRLLKIVREAGYKTCLYSGAVSVSQEIQKHLNYLKTGPWMEELGGLHSITTNQRFINLDNGKCLNHLFQHTHKEGHTC